MSDAINLKFSPCFHSCLHCAGYANEKQVFDFICTCMCAKEGGVLSYRHSHCSAQRWKPIELEKYNICNKSGENHQYVDAFFWPHNCFYKHIETNISLKIKQCIVLYSVVFTWKASFLTTWQVFQKKKKKIFEKARTSIIKRGGGEAEDISFAHVKMQIWSMSFLSSGNRLGSWSTMAPTVLWPKIMKFKKNWLDYGNTSIRPRVH